MWNFTTKFAFKLNRPTHEKLRTSFNLDKWAHIADETSLIEPNSVIKFFSELNFADGLKVPMDKSWSADECNFPAN